MDRVSLAGLSSACDILEKFGNSENLYTFMLQELYDITLQDQNISSKQIFKYLSNNLDLLLRWSCAVGNINLTRCCIDLNADVNKMNAKGRTPLMLAVAASKEDIVELLLENKADIKIVDHNGWTAYNYAECYKTDKIIDKLVIE